MAYQSRISTTRPGCLIVLLDQSFSMREDYNGTNRPRIAVASRLVNRLLKELVSLCASGRDQPRDCFDVALLGYTTGPGGRAVVRPPWDGPDLVSIGQLPELVLENQSTWHQDGDGVMVEELTPIWHRPPDGQAMAGTPMGGALERCRELAEEWCGQHRDSFPPVVVHVTDGEPTDGDLGSAVGRLHALGTDDGRLLLCHVALTGPAVPAALFPDTDRSLPDEYVRALFATASPLPAALAATAAARKLALAPAARCLAVNADMSRLVRMIGGRAATPAAAQESGQEPASFSLEGRMSVKMRRCPRCDRVGHGVPGHRHCLACDFQF